jgi:signal transduction histidine kinase
MSLEYGLKANIIKMNDQLNTFINNREFSDKKIFEDFLILDGDINLINSDIPLEVIEYRKNDYKNATLLIKDDKNKLEFFIIESIYLSNKKVGTIIFKLNSNAIFDYKIFVKDKLEKFYFKYENKFFNILSLEKIDFKIKENSFIEKIPNNLFYTSKTFLAILIVISLVLFLLVYYLYRLNTKNILLKMKVKSTKRINEKLESKVEEKTKELIKLNNELFDKIKEEVSKNKEQESIIHNQSKMAIMGQMLDNIAHQWRQPLSAISTNASFILLQSQLKTLDEKSINDTMKQIVDSTVFLSDTIEDFRGFLRHNKKKEHFKIKDIYKKTQKLLISVSKKSDVKFIENFEDVEMYGYFNELVQVLINIINNAHEAFLEKDDIEDKFIFIDVYKEDYKIVIKIKDNAKGIPVNIIDNIFDAHFTTKDKNLGTGIGLYMTKDIIINNMKGEIFVNNVSYKYRQKEYTGAEFTIKLPI